MKDSKYGIVIQARTSSTRLPGKVLLDIEGKPMLFRQLERLQNYLPEVPLIVATSCDSSDDLIEELCNKNGFNCYRGSLENVILRFIGCAKTFNLEFIIRVGGDDPLIDPDCCSSLISCHKKDNKDFIYASNREGWPYGAAAELISLSALEDIYSRANDPFYREHTIPYFFDNPEEFKIKKLSAPSEICRPDYYFTVDFPEDLELIRTIFRLLKEKGDYFPFKEVIALVDKNKDLLKVNQHLHSGFDH